MTFKLCYGFHTMARRVSQLEIPIHFGRGAHFPGIIFAQPAARVGDVVMGILTIATFLGGGENGGSHRVGPVVMAPGITGGLARRGGVKGKWRGSQRWGRGRA